MVAVEPGEMASTTFLSSSTGEMPPSVTSLWAKSCHVIVIVQLNSFMEPVSCSMGYSLVARPWNDTPVDTSLSW